MEKKLVVTWSCCFGEIMDSQCQLLTYQQSGGNKYIVLITILLNRFGKESNNQSITQHFQTKPVLRFTFSPENANIVRSFIEKLDIYAQEYDMEYFSLG